MTTFWCVQRDNVIAFFEAHYAWPNIYDNAGPFVTQDLASGRLVRPVSHKAICPGEWGLICRRDMKENYRIKSFVDWVAQNAAETEQLLKVG